MVSQPPEKIWKIYKFCHVCYIFQAQTQLVVVCPITNTDNKFPLHVSLDSRTKTTGVILCEHIRTLDLNSRPHIFVERIPDDILDKVIDIISAEIEKISK